MDRPIIKVQTHWYKPQH